MFVPPADVPRTATGDQTAALGSDPPSTHADRQSRRVANHEDTTGHACYAGDRSSGIRRDPHQSDRGREVRDVVLKPRSTATGLRTDSAVSTASRHGPAHTACAGYVFGPGSLDRKSRAACRPSRTG